MSNWDYTFIFSDIGASETPIRFENVRAKNCSDLTLKIQDHVLCYAASALGSVLADMVDVAIAAYVADRTILRRMDEKGKIRVIIPIRHPEIFGNELLACHLTNTLGWFTGDQWRFEFKLRQSSGREAELQSPLFDESKSPSEFALWSGGLDSLGGLYDRVATQPSQSFSLVGVGDNPNVEHLQRELVSEFRKEYSKLRLLQVNWTPEYSDKRDRNSSARARGFTFLMLGAVAALLQGQHVLNVYENGIGALNLPYRASEIGLDHSRAVHPLSFAWMEKLVSEWTGESFHFHNPFFFKTKGEVVAKIASSNLRGLISQTRSCDSVRRQTGELLQCGCCSSCLLRREALAAIRAVDETPYLVTKEYRAGKLPEVNYGDFMRAMLTQVNTFDNLLRDSDPWSKMEKEYTDLNDVADWLNPIPSDNPVSRTQLIDLFCRYTSEWKQVWESLAPGLLDSTEIESWRSKLNIR